MPDPDSGYKSTDSFGFRLVKKDWGRYSLRGIFSEGWDNGQGEWTSK
jgi:hypothetical protein